MKKNLLALVMALAMALALLPAAAFAAEEDAGGVDPSGPVESGGTETPGEPETPTDPGTPETPTDPGTPETPTDPGTPETPTDPGTPETPTDPGTPETPTDPDTPETPTDPGTPETPSQNNSSGGGSNIPGPGDITCTDVDFGTIEKGTISSNQITKATMITNHSDRPIMICYARSSNFQAPGGDPHVPEYLRRGGAVSIYTLQPGETKKLELVLYLGHTEYPFSFRADYCVYAATASSYPKTSEYYFSVTAEGTLSSVSPDSLSVSTNLVDFGKVEGIPSRSWWTYERPEKQTVTVTNTSGAVIYLDELNILPKAGHFSGGGYKDYTPYRGLQPGQSTSFTISPPVWGNNTYENLPAGGIYEDTFTVSSPSGASTTVTARLEVGGIYVTPQVVDFGEVSEGAIPTRAITCTVTNNSSRTYELEQPYLGNDLWQLIVGPLSKTTLAPGDTATFDVTIRPTSKERDRTYQDGLFLRDIDDNNLFSSYACVTVRAPGVIPPEQPTQPETPAEQPSGWAQGDVKTAVEAGLVPEALRSQYTQAITRAEFCALADSLYTAVKGSPAPADAGVSFTDTSDPAILRMASAKVVNGVGGGRFNPDGQLTREQAAAMLSRLAEAVGKPLTGQTATFADMSAVSAYAADPVGQMQATGIMGGVGNNTFAPKNPYTREQSIVTILRLFNAVK